MLKAAFLCLLCALSACDDSMRDTCTGGDNMSNPQIAEGFDLSAPIPELHLTWERGTGKGAALPDSYFDSVRPSFIGVNREVIQSVQHIAPREILIRLAREGLIRNLERSSELELTLEFPDRRKVIDCTHPASADTYIVSITLEFHEGMLAQTTIEQSVWLGDF
jgi:hypothetical protein